MFKLRFTYLALALGLAAGTACSKDDTRSKAENAAENVRDKTDDLKDESKDLAETAKDTSEDLTEKAKDNAADLRDDIKDLSHEAVGTRDAVKEFEYQRLVRMQTLRAVHGIAASQPMLINATSQARPLVDADRAKINEHLSVLQLRLDESANLIQGLDGVDAQHWEERDRATSDAMSRLEDARDSAWDALDDAKALDQTSMR